MSITRIFNRMHRHFSPAFIALLVSATSFAAEKAA
jgi:hypothetical protein